MIDKCKKKKQNFSMNYQHRYQQLQAGLQAV